MIELSKSLYTFAAAALCSLPFISTRCMAEVDAPPDTCVNISALLQEVNADHSQENNKRIFQFISKVTEKQVEKMYTFSGNRAKAIFGTYRFFSLRPFCKEGCDAFLIDASKSHLLIKRIWFTRNVVYSISSNNTDVRDQAGIALSENKKSLLYFQSSNYRRTITYVNAMKISSKKAHQDFVECLLSVKDSSSMQNFKG